MSEKTMYVSIYIYRTWYIRTLISLFFVRGARYASVFGIALIFVQHRGNRRQSVCLAPRVEVALGLVRQITSRRAGGSARTVERLQSREAPEQTLLARLPWRNEPL